MDNKVRLRAALQFHRVGRIEEAVRIYQEILRDDPDDIDALHLLGAAAVDMGEFATAVELTNHAIKVDPDFFAPYVNLGNALQGLGHLDEAAVAFAKATELNPRDPHAASNLGNVLNLLGRHDEAVAALVEAVNLSPTMAEARNNLGNALMSQGKAADAAGCYLKALELKPNFADAFYNLGRAYMELERPEKAVEAYQGAIGFDPMDARKHYNLGEALLATDRVTEAEEAFTKALKIEPGWVDALNNRGDALRALGHLDEAETTFRAVISREPDAADGHWNLSLVLLQQGKFAEAWPEYEWRWKNPDFTTPLRHFDVPRWDGGEMNGETVLIHCEQGFGDTIQFLRYVPMVAAKGARVVLEGHAPLLRLLQGVEGVAEAVAFNEPLPDFDYEIPLISLPHAFGTTLETVPAEVPYLTLPDTATVPEVLKETRGRKVGFAWAGSPTHGNDRNRSVEAQAFEPLFEAPGQTFFSLQTGERAGEFHLLEPRDTLIDLSPGISDFADTAAIVRELDLVVTVDTALAHLAGALGVETWILVTHVPSYHWFIDRDDSPWYPSVKLFHQSEPGAWGPVFETVARELVMF